jgi:type II secretory pathway pseudopilin PulG
LREQERGLQTAAEGGASLVEVLVTVAIISIVLVVFVSALSTGSMGVGVSNRLTTGINLAAAQLESVKSAPYDADGDSYAIVDRPQGYDILLTTSEITAGLQQVTATVSYEGELLIEISDYKVDR